MQNTTEKQVRETEPETAVCEWGEKHPEKDAGLLLPDPRRERVKCIFFICLAALCNAIGVHFFVATAMFAPGGVNGIVVIVKYAFHLADNPSAGFDYSPLLLMLINLPVAFLVRRHLPKSYLIRSIVVVGLSTVFLFLLDNFIDPSYIFSITRCSVVEETATRMIAAVFGGVLCGLALQLAMMVGGSTGGTDIIGALLQQKYPQMSVPFMIFIVNSIIVLVSVFIYHDNLMPIYLAFIYMFAATKTCDTIMCGIKAAMKFEVITDYGEEISAEIIETMGHGATVTPAKGMFEHQDKALLICVIPKRQVPQFKNIIAKYPNTFSYVGTVNEVVGKFNSRRK